METEGGLEGTTKRGRNTVICVCSLYKIFLDLFQ